MSEIHGSKNKPFAQDDDGNMLTKPANGGGGGSTAPDDAQQITQALGSVYCSWQVTVSGVTPVVPAWAQSTAYLIGEVVKANGHLYRCTTAGTSSNSGTGPSATTSTAITDGTAAWKYVESFTLGFAVSNTDDTTPAFIAQHSALTTSKASALVPAGGLPKPMPFPDPSAFSLRASSNIVVTVEAGL